MTSGPRESYQHHTSQGDAGICVNQIHQSSPQLMLRPLQKGEGNVNVIFEIKEEKCWWHCFKLQRENLARRKPVHPRT